MKNPSQSYGASPAIMGSHRVICHPTQVNASRFNPSPRGRIFTYPGWMEGWVDLGVGYTPG